MKSRRHLASALGLVALLACSDGGKITGLPPPPPANKAPQTELSYQFGNDGKVTYTFSGTDSDGSIKYISVRINGGTPQNISNGSSKLVDIVEGTNTVNAIAYDDKDLADPTPAEYSFVSPTESQAETIISGYLAIQSSSYKKFERDAMLSLGASDVFPVDFLITKSDNTNAVINYVDHKEDLTKESANQRLLALFGIPNLYLVRLPEAEIKSRLDSFRKNGFN